MPASDSLTKPSWSEAEIRSQLRDEGYESRPPPVAWFGDDPQQFDELAELVRRGRKRATASLLWRWEAQGGPPRTGDRQTIVDARGKVRAIIEIMAVRIAPFDDVDAAFAEEEGEGDLSLGYWRKVHWTFFVRECERLGREPSGSMSVVCMNFRVVHAK